LDVDGVAQESERVTARQVVLPLLRRRWATLTL
jgi:hypothetical protein